MVFTQEKVWLMMQMNKSVKGHFIHALREAKLDDILYIQDTDNKNNQLSSDTNDLIAEFVQNTNMLISRNYDELYKNIMQRHDIKEVPLNEIEDEIIFFDINMLEL